MIVISCPPWGKIATIDMVTWLSLNACTSAGGGGCGSPSEMMIMCFAAASLSFRPRRPISIVGAKAGMSPGAEALIFVAMFS